MLTKYILIKQFQSTSKYFAQTNSSQITCLKIKKYYTNTLIANDGIERKKHTYFKSYC